MSDLADLSNYYCVSNEGYNPIARTVRLSKSFWVNEHRRDQSAWALIAKAAAVAAGDQK
jgi:hypothetical protein